MKYLNKKLRPALLVASSLLATSAVHAASDGTEGADSTGTTDISITKASLVNITGLSDIALIGTAGNDKVGATTACVYRNSAGTYSVTATGANSNGDTAFLLSSGTDTLAYTVVFDDLNNGATALTHAGSEGTAQVAHTNATCGGGTNSSIEVTVATAAYDAAPTGAYAGTLTLVIAPE
jgi:hypothetical protein